MIGKNWSPFSKLIYLAITFFFLFTAFNSVQNLVSQIYEQNGYENLGRIALTTFNLACFLVSFVAARIIKKLGHTQSLFISSVPFLLVFIAGIGMSACNNFKPAPFYCADRSFIKQFNIVSYTLVGVSSAVLWTAQPGYITQLAPKKEQGSYFGTFFSILQNSYIIGSLLPSILFRFTSAFAYFIIMFSFATVAIGFFSPVSYTHLTLPTIYSV
eukprot:TRINITY_DN24554_c0_g1_i1.p1 TRINITY_DN24554_c0_g1~~TRINITY_DN24554_c0_g1_i1.p1  ORF type:complete len:214 (+),score=40.67 TRINITY_DN24554_c0_g1_i1:229-870(+)